MQPNQEISDAVQEVKKEDKCDYDSNCGLRTSKGLLYCLKADMPDCETSRFWDKYGVDYRFKLAIDKSNQVRPVVRIEDTHEYSIDTLLLLA